MYNFPTSDLLSHLFDFQIRVPFNVPFHLKGKDVVVELAKHVSFQPEITVPLGNVPMYFLLQGNHR